MKISKADWTKLVQKEIDSFGELLKNFHGKDQTINQGEFASERATKERK